MNLTVAQFSAISGIMIFARVWDAVNDPMMGMIPMLCLVTAFIIIRKRYIISEDKYDEMNNEATRQLIVEWSNLL